MIQTNVGLVPTGIPTDFDYSFGPGTVGPMSSVSDLGPRLNKFSAVVFHRKATIAELRNILSGKSYAHVYGKVSYKDVFERRHVTRFSYVVWMSAKRTGQNIWMATERNNDAD